MHAHQSHCFRHDHTYVAYPSLVTCVQLMYIGRCKLQSVNPSGVQDSFVFTTFKSKYGIENKKNIMILKVTTEMTFSIMYLQSS